MEEAELCFPQLNTSCWKPKRPRSHSALIYTALSTVSLLTATFNLLVIVSISYFKQLHTPTNLLILSLALSDFFVGLLLLFQIMIIDGCWLLGDLVCSLYHGVDYVNTSTSVRTMVLISIDRHVAVCHPLHYSRKVTVQRAGVCVSLCWTASLFFFSVLMKDDLKEPGRYKTCAGECVVFAAVNDQVADLILTFAVPVTVIIVLYVRVFVVAVSQARSMRSHAAAVSFQQSLKRTAKTSELKAARTLGLVIFVFLLCVSPYFNVSFTGRDAVPSASAAVLVITLARFNSCLNPLIYAFFLPLV